MLNTIHIFIQIFLNQNFGTKIKNLMILPPSFIIEQCSQWRKKSDLKVRKSYNQIKRGNIDCVRYHFVGNIYPKVWYIKSKFLLVWNGYKIVSYNMMPMYLTKSVCISQTDMFFFMGKFYIIKTNTAIWMADLCHHGESSQIVMSCDVVPDTFHTNKYLYILL